MRRARGVCFAVAAVLLIGVATPAPGTAAKPTPQWRGFDAGSPWTGTQSGAARDFREAKALKADTLRLTLRWNWLSPTSRRAYDGKRAARVDRYLELAHRLGLRVVLTTLNTPCWAAQQPTLVCGPTPPRDPADYGHFVSFVAERWGNRLDAIEVWNEPNGNLQWNGTPGQYVQLVRAARIAVNHSTYKDLPVVGGALSGSDSEYLQQLYDNGLGRAADAVSIHPYDFNLSDGFGDPAVRRKGDPTSFADGVPAIHRTMLRNNDRDPLLVTEFGYATCPATPYCVAETDQARYLKAATRRAAKWRYLQAFMLYRLRDLGDEPVFYAYSFGVLNANWNLKPAASVVRRTFGRLAEASAKKSGGKKGRP